MFRSFFILVSLAVVIGSALGQTSSPQRLDGQQKLSIVLARKLDIISAGSVSQENRAKAYSKFLEGQRFYWLLGNTRRNRSQAVYQANVKASRDALVAALDLNPHIAEAYTILSELAISAPPNDIDEALDLAKLALRVDKGNYGARRIAARLMTYKSGLNTQTLNPEFTPQAVEAWKSLTELDPRNAEAWAFLSLFYEKTSRQKERIEALQKWIAAAPPLESQFFQRITGGRESLTAEHATLKLAEALIEAERSKEAIDLLSQLIADDPDNPVAAEMLREAVSSAKGASSDVAIQALRQAVYANPANISLASLLADLYVDGGKTADGAKVLRDAAEKASDKAVAGTYFVLLGDLYERAGSHAEAIGNYEKALSVRGLSNAQNVAEEDQMFLTQLFQRMIRSAKSAGQKAAVRTILDRAKKALGPDDDFADRELISIYREEGKRSEALAVVRSLRARNPREDGLARLEATLLTELGRVDEAVAGFRSHMTERTKAGQVAESDISADPNRVIIGAAPVDEFSSLLFISQLYTQANRTKDAIEAGNQALTAARGVERRQIAQLTIASAQQMGGDHAGAEATLRAILKESPGNPIALNNLGYFLLERDERYDEALKMIQEALKVDPTNPSYLDSLGWAYFKLGKFAEAEKNLKEAAKFDSLSSTINEHLGDVYQKQGRSDEARRQWQKALELASERSDVERIKGKLK